MVGYGVSGVERMHAIVVVDWRGMDGVRTGTFVAFSLRYHRLIDYFTFSIFDGSLWWMGRLFIAWPGVAVAGFLNYGELRWVQGFHGHAHMNFLC